MLYSGWDGKGEFFYSMEILYGGIPGRPIGDGMDGHSWWPLFENIPTEYLEAYYPLRIDGYTTVTDSGGAGFHRGGNGVEKRYVYLEPGEVSIHDDRWLTRPWGVLGGEPGGRSEKILEPRRRHRGAAAVEVRPDRGRARRHARLPHRGRGRLEGPARPAGRRPSRATSPSGSSRARRRRAGYGVVLNDDGTADEAATEAERARQREERGEALVVRLRPAARGGARQLRGGDRPRAAGAGDAAALVAARAGRRGARARARRATASRDGSVKHEGFHGRAGFGAEARPARDRRQRRLHRPGVAARLRPGGRRRRDPAAARRVPPRGAARSSTRPSPTTRATRSRPPRSSTRSRRCSRSRRAAAGSRSTRGSRRCRASPC